MLFLSSHFAETNITGQGRSKFKYNQVLLGIGQYRYISGNKLQWYSIGFPNKQTRHYTTLVKISLMVVELINEPNNLSLARSLAHSNSLEQSIC